MPGKSPRIRKTVDRFSPYKQPLRTVSDDEVLDFLDEVAAVSPTHDDWKGGDGVAVGRMALVANDDQRREVNGIGDTHGCHSCLTRVESDPNQPWIGDHCPPTSLSDAARKALGVAEERYDGSVQLRPQCDSCSVTQASLVVRVNSEVSQGLKPNLNAFGEVLVGKKAGRHTRGVNATSAKVSPAQGDAIQKLGQTYGCHSCKAKFPKDYYHADHNPPVCYTYSHVIAILEYAKQNIEGCEDIVITQNFKLKPQCPRCSHEQGGRMAGLNASAEDLARRLRLPVY
ncbi:hypothetical protein D621_07410 [beta proteobacterium AAP51]|nr:hypothetical protein D621_07410 [beta proteobacterium AAP51]